MLELFDIATLIAVVDDGCWGLLPLVKVIRGVFSIIQILVPIGLILFGAIDLGKAVMASDEKEIKGATGKLIKRAIAGACVFFAVTIVNVVMGLVSTGTDDGVDNWSNCWEAAK